MLLVQVAWVRRMESRGIKNYPKRFQSAEGCYSHRAAAQPGIRIKMAHKQFVGLTVATLPPPSLDPLTPPAPPHPQPPHASRYTALPLATPPLQVPSDDQIYAVNGAVWQCPKAASVGRDPSSNRP